MPSKNEQTTAVIITTYGSANTAEHVKEYMEHVYKDRVPAGLIEDFEERYRIVGGSPLVKITKQQAELLSKVLNSNSDTVYIVRAAMLHSEPFIESVVDECHKAGAKKIVGIILSPQFSSFIMEGYKSALQNATIKSGYAPEDVIVAGPWPAEPKFVELLSRRVKAALEKLRQKHRVDVPVVFTTHSLPKRVVDKDPNYLDQLKITIDAVVKELDRPDMEWYQAYQSAGHTPEEWLKPDLMDILAKLRDKHDLAVLIVPIQFLANHLEILYDLDIAGKQQCDDYGIKYNRIELPNTDPLFIEALASITKNSLKSL